MVVISPKITRTESVITSATPLNIKRILYVGQPIIAYAPAIGAGRN